MAENQSSESRSDQYQIDDAKGKWYGQDIGVNSNVPLKDTGQGKPYIIRQFEFAFDPKVLKDIKDKKIPRPSNQDLFNSNWHQIRVTLWADGLIAMQEKELPPRVVVGKKRYKIILLCEPKLSTMVAERPNTLQELTKPT